LTSAASAPATTAAFAALASGTLAAGFAIGARRIVAAAGLIWASRCLARCFRARRLCAALGRCRVGALRRRFIAMLTSIAVASIAVATGRAAVASRPGVAAHVAVAIPIAIPIRAAAVAVAARIALRWPFARR